MNRYFSFLLLSGFLFINNFVFAEQRHEANFIEHLLQSSYCVSPMRVEKRTDATENTATGLGALLKRFFNKFIGNMQHAMKIEEFQGHDSGKEKTFELITRLLSSHTQEKNSIIDPRILRDLDILAHENEDIMTVLWHLMQLHTTSSKIATYFTLCNPTVDRQELCARQQLIRDFTQHDAEKLLSIFQSMAIMEPSLAHLISKEPFSESEKNL